jgi:hypothetical protein
LPAATVLPAKEKRISFNVPKWYNSVKAIQQKLLLSSFNLTIFGGEGF